MEPERCIRKKFRWKKIQEVSVSLLYSICLLQRRSGANKLHPQQFQSSDSRIVLHNTDRNSDGIDQLHKVCRNGLNSWICMTDETNVAIFPEVSGYSSILDLMPRDCGDIVEEEKNKPKPQTPPAVTKASCLEASPMRGLFAQIVSSDPVAYSEGVLGETNEEHCFWIKRDDTWEGAIVVSILSKFYQC